MAGNSDPEVFVRTPLRLVLPCLAVITVFASACSSAVLYDTRLEPVHEPVLYASLDYARLAIDSTEAGARAVVEMYIEGNEWAGDYLALHVPTLQCASEGTIAPTAIRREAPDCLDEAPSAFCDETGADSGLCPVRMVGRQSRCLYVVRAEYLLSRIPSVLEQFTLSFGQNATALYWARRKP